MKICLWKRIFLAINCLLHGHKPCNYEDLNASQCLNGTLDSDFERKGSGKLPGELVMKEFEIDNEGNYYVSDDT